MQPKHTRLLTVLLLLALALTLAAPALAQPPGPTAKPLAAALADQGKTEACTALSAQEEDTLARLSQLKASGELTAADYEIFLKLNDRADCAAKTTAPAAISAVASYSFSQFAGTYTPITGGTVHGTGTSVDDNNYNAVNIGFTFNYDGVAYTQVGINANGFVRMGSASFTGYCSYTPISSTDTTNCKNLVSALGMDLQGNTGGELRSETIGTAPNRVFVVQWTDFRNYGASGDSYNFQVRLYETTDLVEFVYGAFTKNTTSRSPQVGLKGATNADFNNRTGTDWAASTAGASNSATMTLSTSSLPASGQTYQWSLPIADDTGVTAITAPVSSCALGNAESVTITIKNFGTATQTSIPVAYRINGGPWVNETWTGSLASGASVNYTFATTADLSAAGTYVIDARTNLPGDGNAGNDQFSTTVVKPATVNTFPYFEGFEAGPAGWSSGGTNNSWQLGAPADTVINSAYEGTQSWTTGLTTDYNASEQSYVLSGCFDFSSLVSPKIDLAVWWQSEFSYDGANLQYTLNGTTWTTVGAYLDPGNWYNDNAIDGLAWSGSQHGWSGRVSSGNGSGGWKVATHEIAALAGQPAVQFRVAFGADSSVQDDGFAFDAVSIYDAAVPPGCAISPSPADLATEVWIDTDLSWSPGPGGTPTSYDVYFGTSPVPPFVVNQPGTTYDPGTMPFGTTHYWQIVPKNSYGSASGCPVWSFTTLAPYVPTYSQSFDGPVPGWTVENTNGDAYTWGLQTTYRRGSSGNAPAVRWNSSLAMDDWLFTPPLQLTGGVTYGLRFFYRGASTSWTEKLEVKWGASNSSAAMTEGPIFTDTAINFTTMKEAIATFTPAASGVYYIGFHGFSAANQFWLIVDDVTVYDTADSTWQWQGGTDTDWFKNANWEGGIVPGELDTVQIPAAPTNQPSIGTSSEASYGRVNDLTVDNGATLTLAAAHSLKVNGTLTNNGTLQQTKNVPLASTTSFLNVKNVAGTTDKYFGADITATTAALGDTTVRVHGNQQCPLASPGMIDRCYDVAPTTVGPADIKFYFSEPEFTPYGHPLPALQVFNYHSGGWNLQTRGLDSGTCPGGAINCWVEGTGINMYSPFGLTEAGPNALRLSSLDAAPVAPWLAGVAVLALAGLVLRRRQHA